MSDKPNIVFLFNDHQVYYRHGWDKGPRIQRPAFDKLASEGVVFERSYTACPLCGPARRTVLTGLFPHNHKELRNDIEAPYDREVYLDALAKAGYKNYYYGKWHAGPGTALDHNCEGFSYPSYGNPYTTSEYKDYLKKNNLPEAEHLIERGFWPPVNFEGKPSPLQEGKPFKCSGAWCNEHASGLTVTPKETHETFFLASLACDKLRELAGSKDKKPFSLRVDFWGPHQPYFPTREFADLYKPQDIPEYGNFRDDLKGKPDIYFAEGNYPLQDGTLRLIVPSALPWSEWQKVLARAYAHTTMVDAAGGMILDALKEYGLTDNTLIVWTTDHGDALACHGGHFDKSSYMPEEMIRVPMALSWPGKVPAGQKLKQPVSNIDLAPTFLDAAGTKFEKDVDGKSLIPLCTGADKDWREDIMCETHGHGEIHLGRAIMSDRYKYVRNFGDIDELYDLENDPYELKNLIDDPECKEVLADMKGSLADWQRKTSEVSLKSSLPVMKEQLVRFENIVKSKNVGHKILSNVRTKLAKMEREIEKLESVPE